MLEGQWAAVIGHGRKVRRTSDAILSALRRHGLRLAGALQTPVLYDEYDDVKGWDLVDVVSGERIELARQSLEPDVCGWGFDHDAFEVERRWVEAVEADAVLLEAARLEARGIGHWPLIEEVRQAAEQLPIVFLRPRGLASIALDLPEPSPVLEIPADDGAIDAFAAKVASRLGVDGSLARCA